MKILVPIDFSEQAQNALNFALGLKGDNEICVLHVIEYPVGASVDPVGIAVPTPYDAGFVKLMRENAEKHCAQFLDGIEGTDGIESLVEMGNPYFAINKTITDKDFDLVVMGTQGASGFKEFLIGSNAEKVVRTSKCPVITLSSPIDAGQISNLVFATNIFDVSEELLNKVKQVQALFEAEIHIVHINTPNNFERDERSKKVLSEMVEKAMFKNYTTNIYNDIYEDQGILSFSEEVKADMILMGTHGRKGLAHLISGSLAEDVVNHSSKPIWTYRF